MKFIVDANAGKLVRLLRLMGYDTVFFDRPDDSQMIAQALAEERVILTRDTHIMERRVVASGRLKAVLIRSDEPEEQIRQVIRELALDCDFQPFTICLECNRALVPRQKDEVRELVPPYVFKTQSQFRQCPNCRRIYWQGTHWQRMSERLARIKQACT